jgi:aerobic-type carbon monoxide dehydrogenase small subunit (CoxS/CutS family)
MSVINFIDLCEKGNLDEAKQMLKLNPTINSSANNKEAFCGACSEGHLAVAKWLLEINPKMSVDECEFCDACTNGHLAVARWLLEINPNMNISAFNDWSFRLSRQNDYLLVAEWLQSLNPYLYVINYNEDGSCKGHYIRSKEEERWERKKLLVWLASDKSPNKKCILYKIPEDVSRYII